MIKKYAILFIVLAFFLGLLRAGLCLSSENELNCCSAGNSNEDCFSHCAKQKADAIKIELFQREESKAKKILFLDTGSPYAQQNYLLYQGLPQSHYLNQIIPKSNISQTYFLATFNHAPPFLLD
jgi:hypothetical protein